MEKRSNEVEVDYSTEDIRKVNKSRKKKRFILAIICSVAFSFFAGFGIFLGIKIANITCKNNNSGIGSDINLDAELENKDIYISIYPDKFEFVGNTYRLFEMRRNRANYDLRNKTLIGYLCENSEAMDKLKKENDNLEFAICENMYVSDGLKAFEIYKLNSVENLDYLCVGKLCFIYKVQGGTYS